MFPRLPGCLPKFPQAFAIPSLGDTPTLETSNPCRPQTTKPKTPKSDKNLSKTLSQGLRQALRRVHLDRLPLPFLLPTCHCQAFPTPSNNSSP